MKILVIYSMLWVLLLVTGSVLAYSDTELDFDYVKIESNGKTLFSGTGSGSIDVEPGSRLSIVAKIENNFDYDSEEESEMDISGIKVEVVLYDMDGDDLSDSSARFNLRPENYRIVNMDIKIPSDASSSRNYRMIIKVTGKDFNGGHHEDEIDFDVEVDRKDHDLVIKRASFPSAGCSDSGRLIIEVENEGVRDETDVVLEVYNSQLGTVLKDRFDIDSVDGDSSNEYRKSKYIDISVLGEGRHFFEVLVKYDGNNKVSKSVGFTKSGCGSGIVSGGVEKKNLESYSGEYDSSSSSTQRRYQQLLALSGEGSKVEVILPNQVIVTNFQESVSEEKAPVFSTLLFLLGNLLVIALIVWILYVYSTKEDGSEPKTNKFDPNIKFY